MPAIAPAPMSETSSFGTARTSMPPVMICAKPSAMPSVPSVTISAGIRATATSKPLTAPQNPPAASETTIPIAMTPQPASVVP